jgi:hypothetical protein
MELCVGARKGAQRGHPASMFRQQKEIRMRLSIIAGLIMGLSFGIHALRTTHARAGVIQTTDPRAARVSSPHSHRVKPPISDLK